MKEGIKIPAKRIIVPSAGDLHLRCGVCGSMDFGVHVSLVGDRVKPSAIACLTCKRFYNVNPDGFVVGSGRAEYFDRR